MVPRTAGTNFGQTPGHNLASKVIPTRYGNPSLPLKGSSLTSLRLIACFLSWKSLRRQSSKLLGRFRRTAVWAYLDTCIRFMSSFSFLFAFGMLSNF